MTEVAPGNDPESLTTALRDVRGWFAATTLTEGQREWLLADAELWFRWYVEGRLDENGLIASLSASRTHIEESNEDG